MRTLLQSLGALQSLARPATLCHHQCRAAVPGCPSAQPAATRAPQHAPPPPAGRTRHHHGPRALPADRAVPRTHCGLRACTESASRTSLGRWRSVPELPWGSIPVAHGLLSAAGGRLRSPGAAGLVRWENVARSPFRVHTCVSLHKWGGALISVLNPVACVLGLPVVFSVFSVGVNCDLLGLHRLLNVRPNPRKGFMVTNICNFYPVRPPSCT